MNRVLLIQYVPLLTTEIIPFVGPGGVLIMIMLVSTWFFQLTGRPYLGAFINTALVTWMFVSSQIIAPIPV